MNNANLNRSGVLSNSALAFLYATCLAVFRILFVSTCVAQVSSGGLTGITTDPGGAVVPNAAITIKNVATGQERKVVTDKDGLYNIPALVPGTYHFSASSPGFGTTELDVDVTLNQATRQDVHFQVGGISQTVEVAAQANQLETESHEVGSVLSGETILALPSAGDDVFSTLATQQNVATYNGSNSYSDINGYAVGGNALVVGSMTAGSTSYLEDGVNNFNLETKTANILAAREDTAEASVQSSGASARFDQPTVVNISTKAGSNKFRGTAYEYLQNDAADAKPYYSPGPKSEYRFNQFGANIGGPIIKNKLQFFASYSGQRQISAYQAYGFFPTAAERTGDFSADAPIYDPNTYNATTNTISQFPGNIIPQDRISQFFKAYLPYLPPQNGSTVPGDNTTVNVKGTTTYDNYLGRLDYTIGKNDSIYGAYQHNNPKSLSPGILGPIFDVLNQNSGTNTYAQETHVFSPTLVNVARFGYNQSTLYYTTAGAGKADYTTQFGVPVIKPNPAQDTPPDLTFYGPGYEDLGNSFSPDGNYQYTFEYLDEVDKTIGKHNLFFGAEFDRVYFDANWTIWSDGQFIFLGDFTGNHGAVNATQPGSAYQSPVSPYADFELGLPFVAQAGIGSTYGNFRQVFVQPYFQDDWNVTPKLKLNLGLRWDFFQAPKDAQGRSAVLNLTTGTNRPGTYNQQFGNFAPRFGFAYSVNPKSVIRGGYGIYYSTFMYNELQFLLALPPNYYREYNQFNTNQPTPIAQSIIANPTSSALTPFTTQINMQTPTTQEWNLALQRAVGRTMTATATYVGLKTQHIQQRINANQEAVGTGIRPYPNVGDIDQAADVGWELGNALQLDFTKSPTHGLSFDANYAWAKTLDSSSQDNTAPRDGTDLRLDYGRADWDRTSTFKLSGVYDFQLPLSVQSWALRQTLGNWQLSGSFYTETGTPFSVTASYNANIGANIQTYANQTCNGSLPNRTLANWFNTACFSVPANGTIGNAGRNDLVGPAQTNLDASFGKSLTLRERLGLQVRLDLFNAFNHPTFGFGGGQGVNNGGFGSATELGGSRRLQLSSRVTF